MAMKMEELNQSFVETPMTQVKRAYCVVMRMNSIKQQWEYLVLHKKDRENTGEDVWLLPGGERKPFEKPTNTVLRELSEETADERGQGFIFKTKSKPTFLIFALVEQEDLTEQPAMFYRIVVDNVEEKVVNNNEMDGHAWKTVRELNLMDENQFHGGWLAVVKIAEGKAKLNERRQANIIH